MTPRLKITHSVIERLGKVQATRIPTMGCLYGAMYDSTLLVVGITFIDTGSIGTSAKLNHCLNFPTEVDLCGIVAFRDSVSTDEMRQDDLDILQDVEITDNPLVLNCQLGSKTMKAHQKKNGKLEEVAFEIVSEEDLWKQFIHVRLQTRLPLICELNRECVREGLQTLRKKVATGNVAFRFHKSGVYLLSSEADTGLSGLTGEPTIGELWESSMGEQDVFSNKKKKTVSREIDVLEVSLLMKPTRDVHVETTNRSAPVIHHIKREFECLELSVRVDALCLVHRAAKVVRLYGALIDGACRSLRLTERNLSAQLESGAGKVSVPEVLHFLPPGCGHFFTLVYPADSTEDQLKPIRETFHKELGLPMDRPVFRRGNRHLFRGDLPANQPLVNTHEGLGPSGVKGGEVSLVQGRYSYHHYMQDRMDDDGWGCAYRSLQTLISWFRWQGYTSLKIPTHREIQQCLVHIGDKPSSFIGTKQWIGSTEVSFVLESMLGIGSRIMSVSSGEELGSKGNELAAHFATQGTPIMIGGGVLAHTILGVDFNKQTGELKFLILDPHYTGGEDLAVIQNKGWCGWKGVNFWVKTAYYNLCLPQKPKCL